MEIFQNPNKTNLFSSSYSFSCFLESFLQVDEYEVINRVMSHYVSLSAAVGNYDPLIPAMIQNILANSHCVPLWSTMAHNHSQGIWG